MGPTVLTVADNRKGQTDMPYHGEHQTLTKQSIRQHVCPSETCCTIISISAIAIPLSRDRSNCGITDYNIII